MRSILFRVVLLACLLTGKVASATVIQASVHHSQTAVGSSVVVTISISGLDDPSPQSLAAFDIDLGFDPGILALTGVSYGTGLDVLGLGSLQLTTETLGLVNLLEISLDDAASLQAYQQDAFHLAQLTFSATGVGGTDLILNLNALGDPDGRPITAEGMNGFLEVIASPVPVPEPPTLAMLLSSLVALLAARRRRNGAVQASERMCPAAVPS